MPVKVAHKINDDRPRRIVSDTDRYFEEAVARETARMKRRGVRVLRLHTLGKSPR